MLRLTVQSTSGLMASVLVQCTEGSGFSPNHDVWSIFKNVIFCFADDQEQETWWSILHGASEMVQSLDAEFHKVKVNSIYEAKY
jgi:hypothetical protein